MIAIKASNAATGKTMVTKRLRYIRFFKRVSSSDTFPELRGYLFMVDKIVFKLTLVKIIKFLANCSK